MRIFPALVCALLLATAVTCQTTTATTTTATTDSTTAAATTTAAETTTTATPAVTTTTTAATTAPPTAPAATPSTTAVSAGAPDALTKSSSLNPAVVGISVVILVAVFAASFYFVVMWPRQSMRRYRREFENAHRDNIDEKDVRMLHKTSTAHAAQEDAAAAGMHPPDAEGQLHVLAAMYGGAPLKRKAGDRAPTRIPTFKDIEAAQAGGVDYGVL